jgi:hypothetical protein
MHLYTLQLQPLHHTQSAVITSFVSRIGMCNRREVVHNQLSLCIVIKTWRSERSPRASEISQVEFATAKYHELVFSSNGYQNMNKSNFFLVMVMTPLRIQPTHTYVTQNVISGNNAAKDTHTEDPEDRRRPQIQRIERIERWEGLCTRSTNSARQMALPTSSFCQSVAIHENYISKQVLETRSFFFNIGCYDYTVGSF